MFYCLLGICWVHWFLWQEVYDQQHQHTNLCSEKKKKKDRRKALTIISQFITLLASCDIQVTALGYLAHGYIVILTRALKNMNQIMMHKTHFSHIIGVTRCSIG